MQVKFYIPHPALNAYIHHVMIGGLKHVANATMPTAMFPATPQQCIYFYPHDTIQINRPDTDNAYKPIARVAVVAAQIRRVNIQLGCEHRVICVSFKAGALHQLIKTPLLLLQDDNHDASIFLGSEIESINDQLAVAKTDLAMMDILNRFFLQKFRHVQQQLIPFEAAVAGLLNSEGLMSVEKAAAVACVCNRQFERQFLDRVGYSPKLFARIVRFSKAYRLKEHNLALSWTSIAHECGYFDQMHLNRDFKTFAGVSPNIVSKELQQMDFKLQKDIQL